jgi:hypothetical protein
VIEENRTLSGAKVRILGTVRGLVREAGEVREVARSFEPDCVAMALGARELDEVREVLKERGEMPGTEGNSPAGARKKHGPSGLPVGKIEMDDPSEQTDYSDFGLFLSTSDLVFTRHLARWGDVEAPPPSYQEALRYAHEEGLEVVAGDFDDEEYTDVFLREVTAFALVRQGRRLRKLAKRRFRSKDAESFAREWDDEITRVKGYGAVEKAREAKVARSIAAAARRHPRVLAIVEVERLPGVVAAFDAEAAKPEEPAG